MAAAKQFKVFTFWEPRGAVTPWLQLCRDTWHRGVVGAEIVTLDHANLADYLPPDVIDMETVRRLPLMHQKDAILVPILERHGGVFIDMDTLMVADLAPVLATLERTSMFNFGGNMSVVGGRAGAPLFHLWRRNVQDRVARVADGSVPETTWDYFAYQSIDEVYVELRERALHRRLVRSTAAGRRMWAAIARRKPAAGSSGSLLGRLPRRIEWELTRRSIARHMVQLGKDGFYPELRYPGVTGDHGERYQRFWFDETIPVEAVVRPGVQVVGLHNSWMPAWYAAMSREEVLAHPSLLSRTLRHLVGE